MNAGVVRPSSNWASQLGDAGGVSGVGGDNRVAVSADTGDTGEAAVRGIFNVASGDVIEATLLVLLC